MRLLFFNNFRHVSFISHPSSFRDQQDLHSLAIYFSSVRVFIMCWLDSTSMFLLASSALKFLTDCIRLAVLVSLITISQVKFMAASLISPLHNDPLEDV